MHNKLSIIGTIGKDIELKEVNGFSFASFSIANNENYTKKTGEKVEKTHWFNVKVNGKLAEIIHKFFKKGDKILIEGSIKTDSYEKDGNKTTVIFISMDGFDFVGGKKDSDKSINNDLSSAHIPEQNDLPF